MGTAVRASENVNTLSPGDYLRAHISICRMDHWSKNVFLLPGIVVAYTAARIPIDKTVGFRLLFGLISVCLIVSSNYVINEILDAPFDRLHPTKHTRPAAERKVLLPLGYTQWIVLLCLGLCFSRMVNPQFFGCMALLWVMGCLYNIRPFRTKDLPYLDVLSEAFNNPIRMMAGWYIITTNVIPPVSLLVSYWMVGSYFMAIKRFSEFREIGYRTASTYRPSFRYYSEVSLLTSITFYASTAMLFLGAFIIRYRMELILSFPLIALVMAIYLRLAFKAGSPVQNPELLYKQPALIAAVSLCAAVMVALLFYNLPFVYRLFSPTKPMFPGSGM